MTASRRAAYTILRFFLLIYTADLFLFLLILLLDITNDIVSPPEIWASDFCFLNYDEISFHDWFRQLDILVTSLLCELRFVIYPGHIFDGRRLYLYVYFLT